jgi:tRNA1(Val) A37 N6-methylase TrmN6
VVRAKRASRGTLVLRPPLILHDGPSDGFSARADAINNGKAALFGD